VRKAALISLLLVAVMALAACGGGGSSSAGGSSTASGGGSMEESTTTATPEEAWANEVTEVMTEFENTVTPTVIEPIHTSTSKQHLEPLYSVYSADLKVLAKKLDGTKAPAACVALRKKMVDTVSKVAVLTKGLSGQSQLNAEQYAAKGYNQGLKIDKFGHALGLMVAEPTC
jgi:hypothetical protein